MIKIEIDVAVPKGLLGEVNQDQGEETSGGFRFVSVVDALDFLWRLAAQMTFRPKDWREALHSEVQRLLPGQLVTFSDGVLRHVPHVSVGKPVWGEQHKFVRTFLGNRFLHEVMPEESGVLLKVPWGGEDK